MSYVALARKWRPRTFAELMGQTHVTQALINALSRNRLHHAYLFTGTRGVGKTSVARLLAKALNCEQGPSAEPCLTCDACLAIEQGRYIDLIEIDAASKTRVEDTRELLENVTYAPTQGRFKVYLIDEVHMLSTHSFNALLKTLEEPPAHVKFLLATTEPQKLPMTVLSRCLQFRLKPLDVKLLQQHLEHILSQEKITYDAHALTLIAQAASGSVRDALSLLDQIIALSDSNIQMDVVKHALGYTQTDYSIKLLEALRDADASALITLSRSIAKEGGQYQHVLDELLTHMHQLSILQALPKKTALVSASIPPELHALSTSFSPEDTQLLYQILLKGSEGLQLAPTLAIGFEMTLLRMHTFRPAPTASAPKLAYETSVPSAPPAIPAAPQKTTPVAAAPPPPAPPAQVVKTIKKESIPKATHAQPDTWSAIIPELKLTGLALNAANNAELMSQEHNTICLRVAKHHRPLFTENVLEKLEGSLSRYYKKTLKLSLQSDTQKPNSPEEKKRVLHASKQKAADEKLDADPAFQHLQEIFPQE